MRRPSRFPTLSALVLSMTTLACGDDDGPGTKNGDTDSTDDTDSAGDGDGDGDGETGDGGNDGDGDGDGDGTGDTTPPQFGNFEVDDTTSPASLTEAKMVPFAATVTDDVGVVRVEFLEAGVVFDTVDAAGGDQTVFESSKLFSGAEMAGTRFYTAKAYDAAGNVAESTPISFEFAPPAAGTARWTPRLLDATPMINADAPDDAARACLVRDQQLFVFADRERQPDLFRQTVLHTLDLEMPAADVTTQVIESSANASSWFAADFSWRDPLAGTLVFVSDGRTLGMPDHRLRYGTLETTGDVTLQTPIDQSGTQNEERPWTASANDGVIYMAGTSANASVDEGWLVRIDPSATPMEVWRKDITDGRFHGVITLDDGSSLVVGTTAGDKQLIRHYLESGVEDWTQASRGGVLFDVAVDGAGDLVVVGRDDSGDGYVGKYDAGGSLIWEDTYDYNAGDDTFTAVAVDLLDRIVVGGEITRDSTLPSAARGDLFVGGWSADGSSSWVADGVPFSGQTNVEASEEVYDVCVDAVGNVYAVGRLLEQHTGATNYDAWIAGFHP